MRQEPYVVEVSSGDDTIPAAMLSSRKLIFLTNSRVYVEFNGALLVTVPDCLPMQSIRLAFVMLRVQLFRGSMRLIGQHDRVPQGIALSTSLIVWGLLFGTIGLGFFSYGKRQKAVVPLICGLALMAVPYFIANTLLLVAAGVALIAIPYFFRI